MAYNQLTLQERQYVGIEIREDIVQFIEDELKAHQIKAFLKTITFYNGKAPQWVAEAIFFKRVWSLLL
ncbi:MAG: hypothetical protein U9O64_11610 [Campylobacterota bacterium]|nr:hypothetical protein [Campylobacterota bacterium]